MRKSVGLKSVAIGVERRRPNDKMLHHGITFDSLRNLCAGMLMGYSDYQPPWRQYGFDSQALGDFLSRNFWLVSHSNYIFTKIPKLPDRAIPVREHNISLEKPWQWLCLLSCHNQ